jgi:hypothetical protein
VAPYTLINEVNKLEEVLIKPLIGKGALDCFNYTGFYLPAHCIDLVGNEPMPIYEGEWYSRLYSITLFTFYLFSIFFFLFIYLLYL